jgi:glycosyltransferase involved in cell wall biosynthesis
MTGLNRRHDSWPELSVVIPAHNEAGFIDQTLNALTDALGVRDLAFEIVVVENGSSDSTLVEARSFAADDNSVVVLTRPVADYGAAMRAGLLAARGIVVVVFDVDYFDPAFVDIVIPLLTTPDGPAIVIGSKRAPGSRDTRRWPRRMITAVFSTVLYVGFGLRASDTHGMKALRRETIEPLARRCRNGSDLFDTELVLRAQRAGLTVTELPVTVEEQRPSRTPIAHRVARTIVGLFRLRLQLWSEHRVNRPGNDKIESPREALLHYGRAWSRNGMPVSPRCRSGTSPHR